MQLTEAGQELLARILGPVRQLEKSVDDVRSLSGAPTGHVALGMMPSVSYILAGRVAVRVARDLPGVSLRIVEGFGGHLVDWLHRGDVDLSLLYGPAADLHLRVTELLVEELVLVGPWASDLSSDTPVPVSKLSHMTLVLPSRPHGLRMVVEASAEKAGARLHVQFEADSFRVQKTLVESGLGFTILPLSAVERELHLKRPRITRDIVLALPSSRNETRATAAVASLIVDEITQMVKRGEWQARPVARGEAK